MHKSKHHRLSRYLWLVVSAMVVATAIALAQFHKVSYLEFDNTKCTPAQALKLKNDCSQKIVQAKDNDLVKWSWSLLAVVAVVDIAVLLESKPSSKKRRK